jgi:imidazolonepropionase-like amidohydrolase/Tol biopolymer transport system component
VHSTCRILAALVAVWIFSCQSRAHTLEFDTTQVTTADVAVAPDGQTVVFTMLGHLFKMPSAGGTAEQLTFGPYFDADPSFSSDGYQIAFQSDRDGSAGNIFLLTLTDGKVVPLTRDEFAEHPTWSPDGKSIVYLRYARWAERGPAVVCRVPAQGGQPEAISAPPKRIGSVFYLPDSRLAWSVIESEADSGKNVTRVEALDSHGAISTVRTIAGVADRVLAAGDPNGLYCHQKVRSDSFILASEDLVFVPLPTGQQKAVAPVSSLGRFALCESNRCLYLGDQGRLWKVLLPSGDRHHVNFHAHVKLEVQDISTPRLALAPRADGVRSILSPRLSPDGRTLVFGASGFLWRQPVDAGEAERISRDTALESEPAFSPDGAQLAFVQTEHGEDSLRLLVLATGQSRTLTSGPSFTQLAWSPDGQRMLAVTSSGFDQRVMAFDLKDGKGERLSDVGFWSPRPQLSADGATLYFSADTDGVGNLYRLALARNAKPEAVTRLTRHLSDARLSPDGKQVVFRRNRSLLTASLAGGLVYDGDVHELSTEGGDTFALSPDGASVIYSVGPKVWLQPLAGGERREIPTRLRLSRPEAPPLLIRGARVLDLAAGKFGPPTSLLAEHGRIQWIGPEANHTVPQAATVQDATGRFIIPGLFDMHVHAIGADERTFLAYGVTSVRDPGDSLALLSALQDRGEFTDLPVPRYFHSGEVFEGGHPYWGDSFLQIDNEPDARDYVSRFNQLGATFIKVYPSLSWPLKRAVADEAHRLGLPLVGHGMSTEEIVKSITLGFLSLEHAPTPDRNFDDVLQMLAASRTGWDPTLAVVGGDSLLLRDEPERLTDAKFKALTAATWIDFAVSSGYHKPVPTATLRGAVSAQLKAVARAHLLGARLFVGTDSPNPECFYGVSLHWELERFVEAGLSPLEVLRLATQEAAAAVGASDLGSLAPGKLADMVLLEKDPLENIRHTESVWRVVKAGWLFDPEKLQLPAPGHLASAQKQPRAQ